MKSPGRWLLMATLALPVFSICCGCSKKCASPTGVNTVIPVHGVVLCSVNNDGGKVSIYSDPTLDTTYTSASATWGVTQRTFQKKYQSAGGVHLVWEQDTAWIYGGHNFIDTAITVTVHTILGVCQGTVTVPGIPLITRPAGGDTLPIGPVSIAWRKVHNASYYCYTYQCDYFDSQGYYAFSPYINGWTTDTAFTVPDTLFTNHGMVSGYFWFVVDARNGVLPDGGSTGNMTGAVKGYLTAIGWIRSVSVNIGQPPFGNLGCIDHSSHHQMNEPKRYIR